MECIFSIFFSYILISFCDVPERYQMTIQDPATDILEWMIDLYDLICFELIVIVSIIFVLLLSILYSPIHFDDESHYSQRSFSHSTELEVFWTVIPALLLISIAYPSFNLLYALDEDFDYTDYFIKIIGHQWYWTYEYHYCNDDIKFDSYMLNFNDLYSFPEGLKIKKNLYHGQEVSITTKHYNFHRLLEVDNRLYLPLESRIVLLITSADVLHSWTVPSFGIKVDACPGRLTKATLIPKRVGLYFGQCSEICGINHGFMPIVVQVVKTSSFEFVHAFKYKEFIDNFQNSPVKIHRPSRSAMVQRRDAYAIYGFAYDMQNDTVDGEARSLKVINKMTPEHLKIYTRTQELEAQKKKILDTDIEDRSYTYETELAAIDAEIQEINKETIEMQKEYDKFLSENPYFVAHLELEKKYTTTDLHAEDITEEQLMRKKLEQDPEYIEINRKIEETLKRLKELEEEEALDELNEKKKPKTIEDLNEEELEQLLKEVDEKMKNWTYDESKYK